MVYLEGGRDRLSHHHGTAAHGQAHEDIGIAGRGLGGAPGLALLLSASLAAALLAGCGRL